MNCWDSWCNSPLWQWCLNCTADHSEDQPKSSCSLRCCRLPRVHLELWLSAGMMWAPESPPISLWPQRPCTMAPLSHWLGRKVLKKTELSDSNLCGCLYWNSTVVYHLSDKSGKLKNTCLDLLWRASEAAALIRGSCYYDAVVHAAANILEYTWSGGTVTGNNRVVIAFSCDHIDWRPCSQLPFS